jgi:hypothetical protein
MIYELCGLNRETEFKLTFEDSACQHKPKISELLRVYTNYSGEKVRLKEDKS